MSSSVARSPVWAPANDETVRKVSRKTPGDIIYRRRYCTTRCTILFGHKDGCCATFDESVRLCVYARHCYPGRNNNRPACLGATTGNIAFRIGRRRNGARVFYGEFHSTECRGAIGLLAVLFDGRRTRYVYLRDETRGPVLTLRRWFSVRCALRVHTDWSTSS